MQICRIWVTAEWDKEPAFGEAVPAAQQGHCQLWYCSGGSGQEVEGPCPTLIPHQWKSHPTLSQLNPHPSTLPTSFAISVVLWCFFPVLAHLPSPQVWLGCLNVEGTGMVICCIYLQNSSLNSFYKYYMQLQKNL